MSIFTTATPALCREPIAPIFQSFKNVHFTNRLRVPREWVVMAKEGACIAAFLGALWLVCEWAAPFLG